MKFKLTSVFAIGLIFLMVYGVGAQGPPSGNVTVDNENIAVKVTGGENVPKFEFWEPGSNSSVYRVQFHQMFEVVDTNDNNKYDEGDENRVPASTQALAPWSWDFSEITEDGDETTFNITGQGSPAPVFGDFDLTFVNHLGANASSFKFDVIVDDYTFKSSNENAMLVLAFTLTSAGGGDDVEDQGSSVEFGGAYMDIEETASTEDGDIGVGMTTPSNGSAMAFIAYENFDGGFEHDPTIGIGEGSSTLPVNHTAVFLAFIIAIPVVREIRR